MLLAQEILDNMSLTGHYASQLEGVVMTCTRTQGLEELSIECKFKMLLPYGLECETECMVLDCCFLSTKFIKGMREKLLRDLYSTLFYMT